VRRAGIFTLTLLCLALPAVARAGGARIIKVLPHYLDLKGRHSTGPSLFERDAYQEYLRRNPEKRSAVRFDVQWKPGASRSTNLSLVLEVRGSKNRPPNPIVLEAAAAPRGLFSTWSSVTVSGDYFTHLGEPTAWRVSLWDGGQFLAEQRSFLW
jgi:hypothetical protein